MPESPCWAPFELWFEIEADGAVDELMNIATKWGNTPSGSRVEGLTGHINWTEKSFLLKFWKGPGVANFGGLPPSPTLLRGPFVDADGVFRTRPSGGQSCSVIAEATPV